MNVEHLSEADSRNQSRGGRYRDPSADVRVAVDDGTRGFGKAQHARGMFHGFEATHDLHLLCGEAVHWERRLCVLAELVANPEQPAIELFEAGTTGGTSVEMRVAAAGGPESREVAIVEMTAADAFKK
jgi:hypothetical protein